jgi:hypothetical protein
MVSAIAPVASPIVGGVDMHEDTHVAAALDHLSRLLGTAEFDANPAGYRALLQWVTCPLFSRSQNLDPAVANGCWMARTWRANSFGVR